MKTITRLFALLVIFYSCSSTHEPNLGGCWQNIAVKNASGEELKTVAAGDELCLNADSSFFYSLKKEMIYSTGTWSKQADTLILNYDYLPAKSGVDSVTISETGLIAYYLDGHPVKRIGMATSLTSGKSFDEVYSNSKNIHRRLRFYTIHQFQSDTLIFEENGVFFSYSR
ncbi:MAG: hypothetical protein ACPF8V_06395 [Luteibaculum sp.]